MELAYPQHRGKLTTLYNTLWYVGSIVAAWTVYGTIKYTGDVSWKVPVALQALMPFIQLLGVFFLAESPRWLCSKGRNTEAMSILVKVSASEPEKQWSPLLTRSIYLQYHGNGDPNNDFVRAEFAEIQETLRLERDSSNQGWIIFLKTPGNRRRLLLIVLTSFFSQCSGNGLVSYYLHDILTSVGVTNPTNQSLFNGGLQIWSWLISVAFSVCLVDRLGRKKLFLIAGIGMLVAFSVWTG
jgi:MFS family permease